MADYLKDAPESYLRGLMREADNRPVTDGVFFALVQRVERLEAAVKRLTEDPGSPHASAEKAREELGG